MVSIEAIAPTEGCVFGEGPHWDASTQTLYFVDIHGSAIVKYAPSTNTVTKSSFDQRPFSIVPVENRKDEFVVAVGNELVVISWNGENDKATVLQKLCSAGAPKTFNDLKCDSSGRLWTGTHNPDRTDFFKSPPVGTLYSFDCKKQLKPHVDKIRFSNGIALNEKTKKMFFIDSLERTVDRFDIDIASGTISNRQVWFSFKKSNLLGNPDGMTIDVDGNLWVAAVLGSQVVKIDGNKPETLLQTISMPAEQITSVAFGGKNLDELYVTTGNSLFAGKPPNLTANGAVLKVTGLGTRGLPGAPFKLN